MRENSLYTLNRQQEKLVGIETIPVAMTSSYPTVVLVHGFAASKSETGMSDGLARRLADIDVLSYRFDFSGCGESDGDSNPALNTSQLRAARNDDALSRKCRGPYRGRIMRLATTTRRREERDRMA